MMSFSSSNSLVALTTSFNAEISVAKAIFAKSSLVTVIAMFTLSNPYLTP